MASSRDGTLRACLPTLLIRLAKREASVLLRVKLLKQISITLNRKTVTLPPGSYETELEVSYPAELEVEGIRLTLNSPIPSLEVPSSVKAGTVLTLPVIHKGRLRFSGSALQRPVELTVDGLVLVALPITKEKGLKDLVIETDEAIGKCKLLVE